MRESKTPESRSYCGNWLCRDTDVSLLLGHGIVRAVPHGM